MPLLVFAVELDSLLTVEREHGHVAQAHLELVTALPVEAEVEVIEVLFHLPIAAEVHLCPAC